MRLSEDLRARGLIKDTTFEDITWLDTPRTFYLGVDCSSDSMTIGNLAVVLLAKRLQLAGWKMVLLVGGATSLIGDPGGKDDERSLKSREEIAHNVAGIRAQFVELFDGAEFTLVDNYDWFKDTGYLEFLRDIGKHYSMTELVQRDFIANRMGEGGSGISYAEFSYSLIQGYDYLQLYRQHGVVLQIGGSDQWGNILSGVPLIRKKESAVAHAMCMPLVINQQTGKKFGKSEAGAVWLDPAKTTPTRMYQFWMNCDDEGSEEYLKIYTFMDPQEIGELIERHKQAPSERLAQTRLAEEVTRLAHGEAEMHVAQRVTAYLTGRQTLQDADEAALSALRQEIPAVETAAGGSVIEALVASGLAASNSDGRRLLQDGGIAVNGLKIDRGEFEPGDFLNGRLLLRKGKKFQDSALIELDTKTLV